MQTKKQQKGGCAMPGKRVTMQDIADACGLSRNTVSKAFNGRGAVPAATRALILKKAEELGYGFPSAEKTPRSQGEEKTIALLTCNLPVDYHFGTYFTTAFTDQISRSGYTLKLFEISREELRQKKLPPQLIPGQIAGIVGIEMFDADYLDMLCALNIPTIMIDSPIRTSQELMACDFVTMENANAVAALIRGLAAAGAKNVGFVGDRAHCGSFNERWGGFVLGLTRAGLPVREEICILAEDQSPYNDADWLIGQLNAMPFLPDAFVCANDYLAIHLMNALKKKGLSIPKDIMITGFDGTAQSALVDPALTTVQIPSLEIGRMAADILLARIRNPEMPYHWTHVKTTPVWRESTRTLV